MSQLNPDVLRDVLNEIIESDGSFKNVDKFMMSGKEPYNLVLNICKKANNVVIFDDKIVVKLPGIQYKQTMDEEEDEEKLEFIEPIDGTKISRNLLLFKPISIALVSRITSLDIREFSPPLTAMLKSINYEINEIYVPCENLKAISEACFNIPKIQNGVTVKDGRCKKQQFCDEMRSFHFPCKKLIFTETNFNDICQIVIKNNHLRKNIHELTIEGNFLKFDKIQDQLKNFSTFISSSFPNLQNLNVNFSSIGFPELWKWNNCSTMADMFRHLRPGIKGCICFKIIMYKEYEINQTEFPDVQKNSHGECYQNFSISETLNFQLASFYDTTVTFNEAFDKVLDYYFARIDQPSNRIDNLINVFKKWKTAAKKKLPSFNRIKLPIKTTSLFKNLRSFKSIRNRFS